MRTELKEIRFQMQISPSQMKAVEDWGWNHRIRTKAEAIRQLLDIGLASSGLVNALTAMTLAFSEDVALTDDQRKACELARKEIASIGSKAA